MQFITNKSDGLARNGICTINEKKVNTPLIFYLETECSPAPSFADVLLTTDQIKTKKPTLEVHSPIFSSKKESNNSNETIFENYMLFPMDGPIHLHEMALEQNKHQTQWCILPPVIDLLDHYIQNNDKTSLFVIANASQLIRRLKSFAEFMITLREKIGYSKLIYLPSLATPASLSLFCYMGIDCFDSTSATLAAYQNIFLFPTGILKKEDINHLPCSCPQCIKHKQNPQTMSTKDIIAHNNYMMQNELLLVRNMILQQNLRQLVESRIRSNPVLTALLRWLDKEYYEVFEKHTPIIKTNTILATSKESLFRPEIQRFQHRVLERYQKPPSSKILLMLPCSAKKPYSTSKSHTLFQDQLFSLSNHSIVHELILTSPLGLVPRELERMYPASSYDIPVIGEWDYDEQQMIRTMIKQYLEKNTYDHCIIHLPENVQEFIVDLFPSYTITCCDTPTSAESLNKLKTTLKQKISSYKQLSVQQRTWENVFSMASYQFGSQLAKNLLDPCTIRGKHPYYKLITKKTQLGMITSPREMISLTLNGAKLFTVDSKYTVTIANDFNLIGSVFAPGVIDADETIRIGDEVVVVQKKSIIGVGVAQMNGAQMKQLTRGEAVKIRHSH